EERELTSASEHGNCNLYFNLYRAVRTYFHTESNSSRVDWADLRLQCLIDLLSPCISAGVTSDVLNSAQLKRPYPDNSNDTLPRKRVILLDPELKRVVKPLQKPEVSRVNEPLENSPVAAVIPSPTHAEYMSIMSAALSKRAHEADFSGILLETSMNLIGSALNAGKKFAIVARTFQMLFESADRGIPHLLKRESLCQFTPPVNSRRELDPKELDQAWHRLQAITSAERASHGSMALLRIYRAEFSRYYEALIDKKSQELKAMRNRRERDGAVDHSTARARVKAELQEAFHISKEDLIKHTVIGKTMDKIAQRFGLQLLALLPTRPITPRLQITVEGVRSLDKDIQPSEFEKMSQDQLTFFIESLLQVCPYVEQVKYLSSRTIQAIIHPSSPLPDIRACYGDIRHLNDVASFAELVQLLSPQPQQ
ncbi:hypothetical protein W97_09058, partial [Coniosporium apollinis CBS 100218]